MGRKFLCLMFVAILLAFVSTAFADGDEDFPVVPHLFSPPNVSVSTVPPANGDLNPYGVAFVPREFPRGGPLHPGDVLVSNFNDSNNSQGTGTTIVSISPNGQNTLFFQGPPPPGLGLTTALGVLKRGYVIVGSVPSLDGSGVCTEVNGAETDVGQGALIILDRFGNVVKTLQDPNLLDGPWDLTLRDEGERATVYVSNVLSGTVTRIKLRIGGSDDRDDRDADHHRDPVRVERMIQIASGYTNRCDPSAFVVGPTGLALDKDGDTLYVASTADNAIFAIDDADDRRTDAGTGTLFIQDVVHLHGPLGLVRAPNGDLITTQGDVINPDPNQPSEIVEYDRHGQFVGQFSIDPAPGSAFGIAIARFEDGFRFAAVDDGINFLDIWNVR